jgi:hypothetical protein
MCIRLINIGILSVALTLSTRDDVRASSVSSTATTQFTSSEPVVIMGYSGPEQDAFITPDNKYLFFDSHNDAGLPINLYWAIRVNYKTFALQGMAQGANHPGAISLRGTYDKSENFYFFFFDLSQGGLPFVASGRFSNGTVTGAAPIEGITLPAPEPGTWRFMGDPAITPDGNTLYFTDWQTSNEGQPFSGQIKVASKNTNGTFTVLSNSSELLNNVNMTGSLVYESAPSADNLSLYFTVCNPLVPSLEIYVATRSSTTDPFGVPQPVSAADVPVPGQPSSGVFVETGSLSYDGNYFYYHRVLSPASSQIYVLSRSATSSAQ